jgi:predicted aspartyl protease
LKIGDKVKVVNRGCIYTTYKTFAEKYNLKKWKYRRDFDDNVYEQTFEVKKIGLHLEDDEKVLCVIVDENEQEYIIGIDGLEKIEDRKRLIQ